MSRFPTPSIAFAAALLCASQAHADNVNFAGFANGSKTVDIALSSPNVARSLTADAGGFTTSLNGGPSFTSYCIDLYEYISFGSTYNDYVLKAGSAHAFANSNAATDIAKLFGEHNLINSSTAQAAFQIAIWEIAYETSGSYNLGSGAARFTGGTAASSGALTLASGWLSGLSGSSANGYMVSTLDSVGNPGHQDVVFAAAVPEPSTYALLAGGLLAIGFVSRRRAAATARA